MSQRVPVQVQFHAVERYLERVRRAPCKRSMLNWVVQKDVVDRIRQDIAEAVEVPVEAHVLFQWKRGGNRPQRILRNENTFFLLQGNVVITVIVFDEAMMMLYEEILEKAAA